MSLQFEVRVSESKELSAQGIEHATHALSAGDIAGAEQAYRAATRAGLLDPASWSNLAALGVALGDAEGACRHAQRALQLDARSSDAWVNLGVASWHAGRRRDAAQAMDHALKLSPGLGAAALNYSRMLRAVSEDARAARVLADALRHNPGAWRLHLADAEVARVLMQHSRVRNSVLQALRLKLEEPDLAQHLAQPGASGLRPSSGKDVFSALQAACDRLEALGVTYHLMAGTLLAIVKDGELFPHDKDVDLALPDMDEQTRLRVRAFFEADAQFRMFPAPPVGSGPIRVIGVIHEASGVGIDLILTKRGADGSVQIGMGWPDHVEAVLRPYTVGNLEWKGRTWPVPVPTEQYLEDIYDTDWREQLRVDAGVRYDRCYSDTMVTNPSRTVESLPRAINLGLLRLMQALDAREWSKSVAYCAQILHRESLPEVQAVLKRLQAAGHEGLRFDG